MRKDLAYITMVDFDTNKEGECRADINIYERGDGFGYMLKDIDIELSGCGHSIKFSGFMDWMGEKERWDIALDGGGTISFSDFDGVLHIGHLRVPPDKRGENRGTILLDLFKLVALELGYDTISAQFGGGKESKRFLIRNNIPEGDIEVPNKDRVKFNTQTIETVMVNRRG